MQEVVKLAAQAILAVATDVSVSVTNTSGLVFSWPTAATGFIFQQNSNLNPTNWTPYGGIITTNGDTVSATISTSAGNIFFRLFHP
jgi:hypothetical protein